MRWYHPVLGAVSPGEFSPLAESTGLVAELVIGGIIDLARRLGYRTIAEGVERDGELELLRTLGCDGVQGFLFSRPVDASRMEASLRAPRLPVPHVDRAARVSARRSHGARLHPRRVFTRGAGSTRR